MFFANFFSFTFHSLCFFRLCLPCAVCAAVFLGRFLFASFVSSVLKNSLMSSSHLFLGFPTDLVVLLLFRPGFHLIILFVHRSCGRDAILFAILHFSLLWVSIRQGIFVFFMGSSASFLLFSMKSIHVFVFIFLERNITVLVFEHCSEPSPVFWSVAQRESFSYCFSIPFPSSFCSVFSSGR